MTFTDDLPSGVGSFEWSDRSMVRGRRACGSALWVWDPLWAERVHPRASAIDTELPVPPERPHLMVGSKPDRVALSAGPNDRVFDACPEESLARWHQRMGLEEPED